MFSPEMVGSGRRRSEELTLANNKRQAAKLTESGKVKTAQILSDYLFFVHRPLADGWAAAMAQIAFLRTLESATKQS